MLEWIVVWLMCLASFRVVKRVVVDGWVQITDPNREPPSLAERRVRAELAQQQAMTTGAPGVGQAVADRLASRIVNPPPRPLWITEALNYLGLLLADAFANARRRHVEKQRQREHGERPRRDQPASEYCWRCDVNRVVHNGDLCGMCALRVTTPCHGCDTHVPVADLEDGRCADCRSTPSPTEPRPAPPEDRDRPGPARLALPALTSSESHARRNRQP